MMRLALVLTLLATGVGLYQQHARVLANNSQLADQLAQAHADLKDLQDEAATTALQLLTERAGYHQLLETHSQLQTSAAARAAHIKRLQQENEALKNWTATELPRLVQCLRKRPAIRTAADYQNWLSSGNTLPAACQ